MSKTEAELRKYLDEVNEKIIYSEIVLPIQNSELKNQTLIKEENEVTENLNSYKKNSVKNI